MGAVAKELFPQVSGDSKHDSMLGFTVGFLLGLFFVNYLDYFVTSVESLLLWMTKSDGREFSASYDAADETEGQHILSVQNVNYSAVTYGALEGGGGRKSGTNSEFSDAGSEADGDGPIMLLAAQAIASPLHRERIRGKISELIESISTIEQKSRHLQNYVHQTVPHAEAEQYADQIDEEIHRFQYSLDNCRRYGDVAVTDSAVAHPVYSASAV